MSTKVTRQGITKAILSLFKISDIIDGDEASHLLLTIHNSRLLQKVISETSISLINLRTQASKSMVVSFLKKVKFS